MEILALIPARGGSKSIPHKNIRLLAGHPLIAFSIAAGLKAQRVTRVIVSTDDEEIASIARSYGAQVPFLRPAEIAQDTTLDLPVFQHALVWLQEHEDYHPEIVVQLRPTSPVRPPTLVDEAIQLLLDHPEADSVRGVVPSGQNPFKMWRIDDQGKMQPLLTLESVSEPYNSPRQALPQTYWQTGHIDAIHTKTIETGTLSGKSILPLIIDVRYTIDIDTLRDWERSERLIQQGELPMVLPGKLSKDRNGIVMTILPGGRIPHRAIPDKVALVVFDFDGVMTDDRVWVDQNGRELVAANRSDGMGIALLRQAGIPALVLSSESNPVVAARCQKLKVDYEQGLSDKAVVLQRVLSERQIDPTQVVYLGNDINDSPCFPLVGCAIVVADAHPAARQHADWVLTKNGGHGAVRELCDLLTK
jgi:YrbI family 3-deoxy-D-manno-octulosonate 8-phosphate phosphatase